MKSARKPIGESKEVLACVIKFAIRQLKLEGNEGGPKPNSDITVNTTLGSLGLSDSLVWADLVGDFEAEWDITVPTEIDASILTLGRLVHILRSAPPAPRPMPPKTPKAFHLPRRKK